MARNRPNGDFPNKRVNAYHQDYQDCMLFMVVTFTIFKIASKLFRVWKWSQGHNVQWKDISQHLNLYCWSVETSLIYWDKVLKKHSSCLRTEHMALNIYNENWSTGFEMLFEIQKLRLTPRFFYFRQHFSTS